MIRQSRQLVAQLRQRQVRQPHESDLPGSKRFPLLVQLHRRQKAEAALRERDQHMSLAASAAPVAMWTWDILQDQIWMTDKGRALFGFALDTRLDYAALRARVMALVPVGA